MYMFICPVFLVIGYFMLKSRNLAISIPGWNIFGFGLIGVAVLALSLWGSMVNKPQCFYPDGMNHPETKYCH